jgi:protein TonB
MPLVSTAAKSSQLTSVQEGSQQNCLPNIAASNTSFSRVAAGGIANAAASHSENQGSTGEQVKKAVTRTQACCISSSRPPYPGDARASGWEGSVVVRALIGTDGSVSAVTIKTSSGYRVLDEAAVRAVNRWRFSPARQGDTPIESYYDVRVKFSLDEAEAG